MVLIHKVSIILDLVGVSNMYLVYVYIHDSQRYISRKRYF